MVILTAKKYPHSKCPYKWEDLGEDEEGVR